VLTSTRSRSDRPVMTQHERLWRIKAELKARRAYTCPHCGSGALLPTLAHDRRGTSICVACNREFTGVD
jgi:transcription elongation factor Elf1